MTEPQQTAPPAPHDDEIDLRELFRVLWAGKWLIGGTALDPRADLDYVLVRREDGATRRVHVISAKLSQAWAEPKSPENVALQARDTVHVFSLAFGRHRVIAPILEELQLQSRFGEPYSEVQVAGQVRASGTYPLELGMRVSDLIRAGGSLSEEAYTLDAELTRYAVIENEYRATEVIDIDLDAILRGVASADLLLTPHDHLSISTIPMWDSEWSVTLEGDVKFPGVYRVRRGETLRQVLECAGGLTKEAFPNGSIFLRESLREREQEQIDLLARRLESDLATLSLQTVDTSGADTLSTGKVLLDQLRDGDRLLVPTQSQVVTVIGEVQQSTSHLYQAGLSREDYLEMSGGITRRADKKLIYVVRASGAVVTGKRSRWFGRWGNTEMRPGDTIEPRRVYRRLHFLRGWSFEQTNEISRRGSGAGATLMVPEIGNYPMRRVEEGLNTLKLASVNMFGRQHGAAKSSK